MDQSTARKNKKASEAARALNSRRNSVLSPERRREIASAAGKAGGRGRPKRKPVDSDS